MKSIGLQAILAGSGFILTVLSGFWVTHLGKPYHPGVFNLHKIIALATVIVIVVLVVHLQKAGISHPALPFLRIVSVLMVLGLFATGALLSLGKPLNGLSLLVHRIAPLVAAACGGLAAWFLTRIR